MAGAGDQRRQQPVGRVGVGAGVDQHPVAGLDAELGSALGGRPADRRRGSVDRPASARSVRSPGRAGELVAEAAHLDHVVGVPGRHLAQRRGQREQARSRTGRRPARRPRCSTVAGVVNSDVDRLRSGRRGRRPARPTRRRAGPPRSASAAAAARPRCRPGRGRTPSTSRFAVFATQLSSVAPDSSVRSPVASSYQVSRGVVGSRPDGRRERRQNRLNHRRRR